MNSELFVYNTLTQKKEKFQALNAPFVGMYVCGPTVYGEAHLGHARPAISFDLIFRYLQHLNYKVRYVRNITDVGHLENDADEGEDKIAKKAKLENLEPMEIAQHYTDSYHHNMDALNIKRPSIEPRASGHIIEQIIMIEKILQNGFAYESNGSVYFDIEKYRKTENYGKLSGRILDDLQTNTRDLDGQGEKRKPFDFALWKKASPEHIMKWPSPWSVGFPGWHLECSAMGNKYLGEVFDIHGGGMDLLFPHHECEIAQSKAANGIDAVRYWLHNNMITINGQKMGKSLGNFITLNEIFSGHHKLLEQAFSPMTIRFFILQSHYRSTLDFSNDALKAAEKGLKRLLDTYEKINRIKPQNTSTTNVNILKDKCYGAMNDDFNSPIVIANLFEAAKIINQCIDNKEALSHEDIETIKDIFDIFMFQILGLLPDNQNHNQNSADEFIQIILELRKEAKLRKDFETSDKIRERLAAAKIGIKDTKEGTEWEFIN
ncbi:MAG: cysteine--tRNA ligase [Bacteroidales bacterium]|nr:cysteine--tRNA ligase [Bacteroidales bacterium]